MIQFNYLVGVYHLTIIALWHLILDVAHDVDDSSQRNMAPFPRQPTVRPCRSVVVPEAPLKCSPSFHTEIPFFA
jgi:hypothetical protein